MRAASLLSVSVQHYRRVSYRAILVSGGITVLPPSKVLNAISHETRDFSQGADMVVHSVAARRNNDTVLHFSPLHPLPLSRVSE